MGCLSFEQNSRAQLLAAGTRLHRPAERINTHSVCWEQSVCLAQALRGYQGGLFLFLCNHWYVTWRERGGEDVMKRPFIWRRASQRGCFPLGFTFTLSLPTRIIYRMLGWLDLLFPHFLLTCQRFVILFERINKLLIPFEQSGRGVKCSSTFKEDDTWSSCSNTSLLCLGKVHDFCFVFWGVVIE